ASGAGSGVANDHVDFVSARRERHGFLICRFAIASFAEFFSSRGRDDRIFKDPDATTGNRSDAREDVHARLLQTTAVLKYEVFVLGLNRERRYNFFIRLAEEVDAQIEVQWVLFDDTGVDGGREVIEFHLRWTAQVGQ